METAVTFVTLSVHEGTNADGKNVRFIRARFQAGERAYLTAFNPEGVAKLELVKRVSRTTGEVRVQTRWPVLVHFQRDTVIGSDVVTECVLEPRAFVARAMQSASTDDLAALDAVSAPAANPAAPAANPAAPAAAPAAPEEALA